MLRFAILPALFAGAHAGPDDSDDFDRDGFNPRAAAQVVVARAATGGNGAEIKEVQIGMTNYKRQLIKQQQASDAKIDKILQVVGPQFVMLQHIVNERLKYDNELGQINVQEQLLGLTTQEVDDVADYDGRVEEEVFETVKKVEAVRVKIEMSRLIRASNKVELVNMRKVEQAQSRAREQAERARQKAEGRLGDPTKMGKGAGRKLNDEDGRLLEELDEGL